MKKLLMMMLLVAASVPAIAEPDCRSGVDHKVGCGPHRPDYRFNDHNRHVQPHPQAVWRGNDGWILPAIILGSILTIEATRPATVVVEQPVYVAPQQVLPAPPYGYRYINAIDPACNCSKIVLVPN